MLKSHFSAIWESVADAVPEHIALIQGERRITWRDYESRSARLAQGLMEAGLGKHAKVGMYLYNSPEYAETNFAALKIGGVPINVNYRYLDEELFYLLENADVEALVFHRSLGNRVARICHRLPQLKIMISVDDGVPEDDSEEPSAAIPYESLIAKNSGAARITPEGDEIYMFYTGGTTGMPKGVMYPVKDFTEFFMRGFPSMIGLSPFETADQMAVTAKQLFDSNATVVSMSGPPLMHGTGSWLGLMFPHMLGGTSVMLESRGLKPEEVWDAIDQHKIAQLVIVGDAFAKPLLRALEAEPDRWNTSSLRMMISSGAMFTTQVKRDLIEHIPELAIADVLGSTEGGMGQSIMTKDTPASETAKFMLLPTSKVLLPDSSREVTPGSGEVGMVAQSGMVPLGYYKDPKKSAGTFKEIDGKRYAFPGDMATVAADGSINLLGRGSNCINTGGEKVFPEEVEEALKLHDAVEDALVFGLDDERFGSRVAGVVSLEKAKSAAAEDIVSATRTVLASYKLPKELIVVPKVPRAPNGKADYKAAKQLLVDSRSTE
ncbi:acyl-CoA synthase [marine gamma proteobacterium HTCC2080]|nr:acyl-CoA synthase [marine gamma proteobacterium HTCC2080]